MSKSKQWHPENSVFSGMRIKPPYEEEKYGDGKMRSFLDALEESDLGVSEFEQDFIDTNKNRESFTDGQKRVIHSMITRYGHQVRNWL